MTACAYRSLEPVLRQRVADLCERRERDAGFVDLARRVASRRIARAVGGAVGVALGVASFAAALGGFCLERSASVHLARVTSTGLLLFAWPAALVFTALARFVARALLSVDGRVPMSGNPAVDLANLEATDPLRDARDLAVAWERKSAVFPVAALSLLAPLTLHGLVWFALGRPQPFESGMGDFGEWIALSVVIVGHAHLALLVCAVRWAYKLGSVETPRLRLGVGNAWGTALLVSAGVACLPGVVLIGIPPILVLVTGLAFVPLMYFWTARTVARERVALEAT